MNASDDVAIVALVVSLIALFITFIQLLHSLFGTAEGYRRCAESVIGVWHETRRRYRCVSTVSSFPGLFHDRYPIIWELRFETRYITPQIALFSPDEFRRAREDYEEVHLLNSSSLGQEWLALLKGTVHPSALKSGIVSRAVGAIVNHLARTWNRITRPLLDPPSKTGASSASSAESKTGGSDPEKAPTHVARSSKTRNRPLKRNGESELLVTWLELLRELHTMYSSYWPMDCDHCTPEQRVWGSIDSGYETHDQSLMDEYPKAENMRSTDAAVIYRRWRWEFMPPEMIKPLAEVTLGDVIILALRMGLKWRKLDLDGEGLQANGNGFSLSTTDVRGLGNVLRFTTTGLHERFDRLIPSRAGDKLLNGIIPGCPRLVEQDFHMIGNDRQLIKLESAGGLFSKVGVPDEKAKMYVHPDRHWSETHNELVILLCPFLPLTGSTIARFTFPAWGTRPLRSVFRFWEGREAIKRGFDRRYKETKGNPEFDALESISRHFNTLQQDHAESFYRNEAILNQAGTEEKKKLIDDCRKIFDFITNALEGCPAGLQPPPYFLNPRDFFIKFDVKDETGMTRLYVHLVAAHACMSIDAIEEAMNVIKEQKKNKKDRSQEVLRREYGFGSGYGHGFTQELWLIGNAYVRNVAKSKNPISEHLRSKGVGITDSYAEIVWWLLMLRGLAWGMSTWWDLTDYGNAVPSSFFGSSTPIWIT